MTVLTTGRLSLRMPTLDDWPACRDFYGSEAARPLGGPLNEKDAWRVFSGAAGHWTLKGYGWFTVEDTKGVVGTVGLHHPPVHADMEIGWVTYAPAQRRGYAVEAAEAVLAWGRAKLGATRIVSYIDPDNAASQAVARRLGATCDGTRAAHDPGCEVWVHGEAQP